MKIGVYPGSFDPVTNGHLDIIERASKLFDKLIVGVGVNNNKKSLFSVEKRLEFIEVSCKGIPNVEVHSFSGLLIEFMKEKDAKTIVKGLRAISDFEYEFQMSLMNKKLNPDIETVFMMSSAMNSFLSSSSVKQVAMFGGCIRGLVPEEIIPDIVKKIDEVHKNY